MNCTVNTEAELETALDTLDVVTVTAGDISEANLYTLLSDVTQFWEAGDTLSSGAISSGFGNIDIGSSNLDADGTITFNGLSQGYTFIGSGGVLGSVSTSTLANQVFQNEDQRLGFAYATTSWTGTTIIYMGPAYRASTVNYTYCESDVGTVGVSLYDGSNRANYIPTASTTINKFEYTTNNTFTAGESMRVDLGTPASSPTRLSCSFGFKVTD